MRKKLLSILLAFCMALALLPTYALAFDAPAGTEYWTNLTYDEANSMALQMHNGTLTENVVLVAYPFLNCPLSAQLVPNLPAFAAEKEVHFYGYGANALQLPVNFNYIIDFTQLGRTPLIFTYNAETKKHTFQAGLSTTSAVETLMSNNGLLSSGGTPTPPATDRRDDDSITSEEWNVLRLTNQHRMSIGLQPLSTTGSLQMVANQRAYELITLFSHDRPDGSSCETAFSDYSVAWTALAENIAQGQSTSASVVTDWLNSSGHKANIESANFTHLGVGYEPDFNRWSQNFVGAGCQFSNLKLSASEITGSQGTDLETLLAGADITVTAACSVHGTSSLPLIAAMCTGYDPNAAGTQVLTVTYGGNTATLTVTAPHTHTWDDGVVKDEVSCTTNGVTIYTCTECGETKEESVPATGHSFKVDDNGDTVCEYCGTAVPGELEPVYKTLTARSGSVLPSSVEVSESAINDYLTEQAENVLAACESRYICTVENGKFIDNNTKYQYQLSIRPYARGGIFYELLTEPLTLVISSTEAKDEETYYISIPTVAGGEVIPSTRYAESGARVTLSAHPDSGYELDSITVTDIRGRSITVRETSSGMYTFTMPAARVTVDAKFKKTASSDSSDPTAPSASEPFTGLGTPGISGIVLNPAAMPFTDVQSTDWFYSNVEYVWQHYLMSGVSDTQFAPNTTTIRAMIWTVLARMNNVRTDINPGSVWYEKGMLWALEQGVTDGSDPMGDITREQLATMLWRNAGQPGGNGDLSGFSDSDTISSYAVTAVRWAVANGILNGDNGRIDPQGTATRAQVAAMVARYGDKIVH